MAEASPVSPSLPTKSSRSKFIAVTNSPAAAEVGSSVNSHSPEALEVTAPRNSAGSPKPVGSGSAIQTPTQVLGQASPETVSSVPES